MKIGYTSFELKTIGNFKATANFFNFLFFQKKKKNCNKSVKLIFITLHKNTMIQ